MPVFAHQVFGAVAGDGIKVFGNPDSAHHIYELSYFSITIYLSIYTT